ncbi:MAG: glycosyltransferase [Clostridiales bacterium]|nr:glycosyltransferase [Clostridiales bacterium]
MTSHQPLLSVIIPVWNGGQYLEKNLRSLLTQSITDMEIIVVDDGSTDNTPDILAALQKEDGRIQVIRQKNAGVSAARNRALEVCRGRYIRFVDADDFLPEDSLKMLVTSMEQNDSDLVIAAYTEVLLGTRTPHDLGKCNDTIHNDEFLRRLEPMANSFYYGVLWNKLFRGDIIRDNALRFDPRLVWAEDFCFVMDYCAHAERITYSTELVYDYIRNPKGAVIRHFKRAVLHPIASLKDRYLVYSCYRELYKRRGAYEKYRRVLWLYLIRFTLRN